MKNLKALVLFFSLVTLYSATYAQSSMKRADKQYELSVYDEAVQSYKEVLQKYPNNPEANKKIADCYRHLNQLGEAVKHYQVALASGSIEDIYVFQYGLSLQGLGRYELAKGVFEKLGTRSPQFALRCKQFVEACDFAISQQDPPRYKVTNEFLNKPASDFGVTFYDDGKVVYSSSRDDIRSRNSRNAPTSNVSGSNKLLITQRDRNGYLETPKALHTGFGTSVNEGPVSYTRDGKWVAITKNNFSEGIRQIPSSGFELSMYIAEVNTDGDWNNATPFPHNGVGYSTGYPCFSPDGKALFFASDKDGGYGGFDLYVTYRVGNSWSAPENLGPTVNSLGNEITPFYDGVSLYFASDFHKGFGGFDIFRAEESNNRWATLYHGGTGLNSSYDDYGYIFDQVRNLGYFVSNREGGKGNEDIYKVEKETDNIVIKVVDAATNAPVANATIDFSDCDDQEYFTNANGVFNFQMLDDLNCTVVIKKEGYLNAPVNLTSMGLRQNRTLEVELTNLGNAYQGKTVNASNGYYLEDVKIIATERKTGLSASTRSDIQGSYIISLSPGSSYLLRFSKPGFQDVTLTVSTSPSDSKTLRNIDLLPVGYTGTITPAIGQPGVNSKSQPTPASGTIDPQRATAKSLQSGYAIQVAALQGTTADISRYEKALGDMGSVYPVVEGGKTKVRVGIFASRDEAISLQKRIRTKGYSGAFIVTEEDRALTTTPYEISAETKRIGTAGSVTDLNGIMVRLAAYSNLNYFDQTTVDDLGMITYIPKGEFTIVLLRGYDTEADASIALRKVKSRGFPEAHLVKVVKGEVRKME